MERRIIESNGKDGQVLRTLRNPLKSLDNVRVLIKEFHQPRRRRAR